MQNLMTVKELASYLSCSSNKVYELASKRKIKSCRIVGSIRFRTKDVENYLDSKLCDSQHDLFLPYKLKTTIKTANDVTPEFDELLAI